MTAEEKQAIANKYKAGTPVKEIAKQHYICRQYAYNILRQQKVPMNCGKSPGLMQMMINDWNADISTERMARVYNYSCERSLLNSIRYYRKKGYNFKTRKAGRKKKHGNQDTASNRPGNNTERICDNGHGDLQATGFRQAAE